MKPVLFAVVLVASLSSLATASSADPVYSELKAFRNYFSLERVDPPGHHFQFWFVEGDYIQCTLSGDTAADFDRLQPEDLNCAMGILSEAPPVLSPVPTELQGLRWSAEQAVRRAYPNLPGFKVAYAGRYRTVKVSEIIPTSPIGDSFQRTAIRSHLELAVYPGLSKFTLDPTSFDGGTDEGALCAEYRSDCEQGLSLINFQMPVALQGSSLLFNRRNSGSSPYSLAWQGFSRALAVSLQNFDGRRYQDPLPYLLASQGTTFLPSGISQMLNLEIELYKKGVPPHLWRAADGVLNLRVPTQAAYLAPFTATAQSKELGCEARAIVDLARQTLHLEIVNADGTRVVADYQLAGSFFVDGPRVAVNSLTLERTDLNTQPFGIDLGLTLPASRNFVALGVYPATELKSSMDFQP